MRPVLSFLLSSIAATLVLFPDAVALEAPVLTLLPWSVVVPGILLAWAGALRVWPLFAIGALYAVHHSAHASPDDLVGAGVWAIAATLAAVSAFCVAQIEDL